jgi:hypothetical protein
MKRILLLVLLVSLISIMPVFSLNAVDLKFADGDWAVLGTRLYQNNLKAGMARVDIPAPQAGMMVYEFNVKYEDGAEDMHAGFGVHLFVDKPARGKAWGNGKSYLLWLNYDKNAKGITKGLSAQIYKSVSNSKMELLADIDLNKFVHLLTAEVLDMVIPVKMVVNGFNGDVKIYDPSDSTYVYKFNLGSTEPLTGQYMSLRTNSMGISFGM